MDQRVRLFISGKISGDSSYKDKFDAARRYYEDRGYVVINPAVLPTGLDPADYARICFAMIDSADAVVFLPDYQMSAGAMLEYQYCLYTDKSIKYLSGGDLYGFGK